MASSACRGLVRVGRRCQTPRPAAVPLLHLELGSRHVVAAAAATITTTTTTTTAQPKVLPPTRGYACFTATNAPRITRGWGRGAAGAGLECRGGFSTSPAETGGAGKVDTDGAGREGLEGEAGGKVEDAAAPTLPDEENPLEGLVADDGDPGPPPPLDPSIVTEPSAKVLEVMEGIDSLNFMELAMLIDLFKNKLGLDEVPTLNYGGKGGDGSDDEGGAGAADAPPEKTLWKVKVTGFGEKAKIKVIKEVRAITGLGLREAKEVVESLPQVVKEDLKPEEAEAMKVKLEAAGATVEVD